MTQLPGVAGRIEQIIGLELTVRLLKARGGTEIVIPTAPDMSQMSEIIGPQATQKLIENMGAGRITLPCAHMRGHSAEIAARRAKAIKMLREGATHQEVALACDLHLRTVGRYNDEIKRPDLQGKLPL